MIESESLKVVCITPIPLTEKFPQKKKSRKSEPIRGFVHKIGLFMGREQRKLVNLVTFLDGMTYNVPKDLLK